MATKHDQSVKGGGVWTVAAVVVLTAGGLFVGLAGYLRLVQHGLAASPTVVAAAPVEPARVQRAVRAMDLIAVRVDTKVSAISAEESWRGDVSARVESSARLYFGTDLSAARIESIDAGGWLAAYRVVIPLPRKIATELIAESPVPEVKVGWLRLRSRAGEYHLGLARRGLSEKARELTLSPEDELMVRDHTRERVAELIKAIVGERAKVVVEFADEPPRERGVASAAEARAAGTVP